MDKYFTPTSQPAQAQGGDKDLHLQNCQVTIINNNHFYTTNDTRQQQQKD